MPNKKLRPSPRRLPRAASRLAAPTIAFQGAIGAYSEMACHAVFPDLQTFSCPSFEDAFVAVRNRKADLAMIPVENAIAGRVADIHHLLPQGGLSIIGEHYQPVTHHLLATPGAKLENIREAWSHVQALQQCRAFLRKHGIKPVLRPDTATAAAEIAALNNPRIAAIASALAGKHNALQSLKADIADRAGNHTRFLILSRKPHWPESSRGRTITTLVFRVRSVPAALYKALGGFATNGINLSKLESYLVDDRFTAAQFLADVEAHPEEPRMRLALDELSFFAEDIKIMGVYPAHVFRQSLRKR